MNKLISSPRKAWAMPRRSFLGLGAAAAGGLLMPFGAKANAGPQRGGHLIMGIDNASTSDRIDPAHYTEIFGYHIGSQLFDTLVDLDENGLAVPALAEAWEPRNGGAQWVFTLRKGVLFHNGKILTPEDVIYSLNHHRGEATQSAGKGYLLSVTAIAKTGDMEITVDLDAPNADFPYLLSDIHYVITIDGKNFDDGIGTGPYVLDHFEPGVRMLSTRNENYWNPNRGFVESVEMLGYNDHAARVAALMSGGLHYVSRIDERTSQRLAGNANVQILVQPDAELVLFVGRSDQGPFANQDVRKALKAAINREQMQASVFAGAGDIAYDNPLFPSNRYFSRDLPTYDYDADKAAYHWNKAGIDGPITLSVADGATFAGAGEAAQLYQASALAAGLPFDLDRVPADGYWSDIWMQRDFCVSGWSARPTADAMLSLLYHSQSTWNETYWKNDQFDQILVAARGELDEGKRAQMYHDAQLLIVEDSASIIPLYSSIRNGAAANLRGWKAVPGQIGHRTASSVWFEA